MSSATCWECGYSYSRDEVFDIPMFNKGFTIQWCLNCAMKQLDSTDYRLVKFSKGYKRPRIKNEKDDLEEYNKMINELILGFESQFRKIKDVDGAWGDLQEIVLDTIDEAEENEI